MNGARADDTKGMKNAIVDWITPPGQSLTPPINRKIKSTRGYHHERTGALLCPAGLDWTIPQCALILIKRMIDLHDKQYSRGASERRDASTR
jgi:hypothetical protein